MVELNCELGRRASFHIRWRSSGGRRWNWENVGNEVVAACHVSDAEDGGEFKTGGVSASEIIIVVALARGLDS